MGRWQQCVQVPWCACCSCGWYLPRGPIFWITHWRRIRPAARSRLFLHRVGGVVRTALSSGKETSAQNVEKSNEEDPDDEDPDEEDLDEAEDESNTREGRKGTSFEEAEDLDEHSLQPGRLQGRRRSSRRRSHRGSQARSKARRKRRNR